MSLFFIVVFCVFCAGFFVFLFLLKGRASDMSCHRSCSCSCSCGFLFFIFEVSLYAFIIYERADLFL